MVNKRTLKALRAITDGFIALTNEFEGQEEVAQEVPEEVEQDSEVEGRVELDSMSYADLKELAKELGVTAKGDRDTVQKAIADYYDSGEEETEDEEQEEMSEDAEEEEEDISEEETSDEEEEPVDDTESKVNEAVADMSDEDIADFLADAGISPKGKRQALIAKVVKAVEDGIISLDDSEEEETDDTEDTSENEEETEDSEEESGEELSSREKAIEKLEKDFVEKNEKGEELNPEISREILKAYNFATEKELSKMSDKDILNKLVDSAKYFVGDDCKRHIGEGNDPYTINDVPYCCGHKLKKQQGNVYKCEVCNTEYEAEEE